MSREPEGKFYEASDGIGGIGDPGRRPKTGAGEPAPLQFRASFLNNWGWASVANLDRGLCQRAGADYGASRENHLTVEKEWERRRNE